MKLPLKTALIPAFLLLGCSENSTPLPINIAADSANYKNLIEQTAPLLIAACPRIATNGATEINAKIITDGHKRIDYTGSFLPDFLSRGWDRAIEFTFKHPVNQGQCFIKAGGGLQPGLEVTPSRCFDICNGTQSINDTRFQIMQPAGEDTNNPINHYQQRWREEIQKISNKANQGDYQAQRNFAYLLEQAPPNENHAIQACAARIKVANHKKPQPEDIDLNQSQANRACTKLTSEQQAKALDFKNVFKLPN